MAFTDTAGDTISIQVAGSAVRFYNFTPTFQIFFAFQEENFSPWENVLQCSNNPTEDKRSQPPVIMKTRTTTTRNDYPHLQTIGTRWKDNDVYGHVNNVEYYSFFDTVINKWLIKFGALDIQKSSIIGVCAESNCRFHSSVAFPDNIDAGLRIAHIGRSSVRYEIGLFCENSEQAIAEGWFVHVFVSRETRESVPIPDQLRLAMATITRSRDGESQG